MYSIRQMIKCIHTVNLSADALAIPGGYVVPERGKHSPVLVAQVKFCFGMLEWQIRWPQAVHVGTTGFRLPGFSIPDESATTNPASFTFHNISLENNPSPAQCCDQTIRENSTAMVIAEGEVSIQGHKRLKTIHGTYQLLLKLFYRQNQVVYHIHSSFYSYACDCVWCAFDKQIVQ